jgi:flagellar biosynthesis component FlhA
MNLIAWFFLLVVQNAAFTLVSRARNSGSYGYHAIASVMSNGIFFISQFLLIGMAAKPGMPLMQILGIGAVYIAGTATGSILMHWLSLNYLERGKRKVGAA